MVLRQLPLLDIGLYYSSPSRFADQLRSACHRDGFFLLRHDLPEGMAQRQLDETRRFFHQPLSNKLQISYEKSPAFRGYMKMGVENTSGKTDIREQVEFAVESEHVAAAGTGRRQPLYERIKGKNPWPDAYQPTLRQYTMEYVQRVRRIADCIRDALCLALGLDKDALAPLFQHNGEDPHWVVKLISYPPCSADSSFGVGPHTDTNFLTLVLQDEVGGLQVFSGGEWIDVPTDKGPDVLVCNLGEQAEILSRGYFLATPHRVLANSNSNKERISVPLFYNPSLSATIQPIFPSIPDELPWERPGGYETDQHWRRENNAMLETVGDNTFKSLARSHPEVFRKHHSDLQVLPDGRIVEKETGPS